MLQKFFRFPFAVSGNRTAVPDPLQAGGEVSYEEGFTPDYELINTDPDYKDVPRQSMNELFYDLTDAVKQYQTLGVPEWITAANNGGVAYPYGIGATVKYTVADGGDDLIYISLVASNTVAPNSDPTKWALRTNSSSLNYATAAGTADAITATFAPAITAWTSLVGFLVRAGAANTIAAPTFSANGLAAKTIVQYGNLPLVAGSIKGAGMWLFLMYDVTLDKVVLMNPAPAAAVTETISAQTINTFGIVYTFPHSLGVIPSAISWRLTCLSAEFGYLLGDVVEFYPTAAQSRIVGESHGTNAVKSSTNVRLIIGDQGIMIIDISNGESDTITAGRWSISPTVYA